MRSLESHLEEVNRLYRISFAATVLELAAWVLLFYLPTFTTQLDEKQSLSTDDTSKFKGLYIVANVIYLVTWCMCSSISQAAENFSLEPEYDDYADAYDAEETEEPAN